MIENFLNSIRNVVAIPDLRKRILFTLAMLAVYRVGSHVRAPGIDPVQVDERWPAVASSLRGVLHLFSGSNYQRISLVVLSMPPFTAASILLLLTTVGGVLLEVQEEGEM